MKTSISARIAAIAFALLAASPAAASELEDALANGATKLNADEITSRLSDKTVTFENLKSGAKVLIYYDGQNGMVLQPVGSDKTLKGFYATDLSDHVCIGIEGDKPLRLRCMTVLLIEDVMYKYELDGSLRGRVIEEVAGNKI